MSACERCWTDAYRESRMFGGSQVDHYRRLIEERRDRPCSVEEQRGPDPITTTRGIR
ncbi:MAG TPA: hypothetical protein VFF40_02520 [Acidimicrobiia bacterium]|nr:hypothetical protein [Acidimicrobiia bacterium]